MCVSACAHEHVKTTQHFVCIGVKNGNAGDVIGRTRAQHCIFLSWSLPSLRRSRPFKVPPLFLWTDSASSDTKSAMRGWPRFLHMHTQAGSLAASEQAVRQEGLARRRRCGACKHEKVRRWRRQCVNCCSLPLCRPSRWIRSELQSARFMWPRWGLKKKERTPVRCEKVA